MKTIFLFAILLIAVLLAALFLQPPTDSVSLPASGDNSTLRQNLTSGVADSDDMLSSDMGDNSSKENFDITDNATPQPTETIRAEPPTGSPGLPQAGGPAPAASPGPGTVTADNDDNVTPDNGNSSSSPGIVKRSLGTSGTITTYNTGLGFADVTSGNRSESPGAAALRSIGVTPLLDSQSESEPVDQDRNSAGITTGWPEGGTGQTAPEGNSSFSPGNDIDQLFNDTEF